MYDIDPTVLKRRLKCEKFTYGLTVRRRTTDNEKIELLAGIAQ